VQGFKPWHRNFQLVHEDDLNSAKEGFATVRCEHIYLLQKGKHAEPNAALHQADAHLQRVKVYESSKWGVLKNKHAVRLADHGDYQDMVGPLQDRYRLETRLAEDAVTRVDACRYHVFDGQH